MAGTGTRTQDLLGRLADLSEEAIQRLAETPGADRVVGTLNGLRERVDDLQKRVRGLENLEKRLDALEQKVDALAKGAPSHRSTARSAGSKGESPTKKS